MSFKLKLLILMTYGNNNKVIIDLYYNQHNSCNPSVCIRPLSMTKFNLMGLLVTTTLKVSENFKTIQRFVL